jgi:hypothetical protein
MIGIWLNFEAIAPSPQILGESRVGAAVHLQPGTAPEGIPATDRSPFRANGASKSRRNEV